MELSRFTDYALRTLITLAAADGIPLGVAQIAGAHAISPHHLHKVVGKLARLGHVTTQRGRGGGVALARNPEEINVGALVRETESFGLVDCLSPGTRTCAIDGCCGLKGALIGAQRAFLAELDQHTLADIAKSHRTIRANLSLTATK